MARVDEVVEDNSTPKTSSKSNSTKPIKYPNLFYSPDYQQLFNKEIKEITMELLQTAEVALSSFDYKTINTVADFNPSIQYDNFGNVLSTEQKDEQNFVSSQTDPDKANDAFNLSELVIIPVKNDIQQKPGTSYSSILSSFGYHSSGPDIVKYRPGYSGSGSPYYDLEVSVTEPDGLVRYNIYIIEEVD